MMMSIRGVTFYADNKADLPVVPVSTYPDAPELFELSDTLDKIPTGNTLLRGSELCRNLTNYHWKRRKYEYLYDVAYRLGAIVARKLESSPVFTISTKGRQIYLCRNVHQFEKAFMSELKAGYATLVDNASDLMMRVIPTGDGEQFLFYLKSKLTRDQKASLRNLHYQATLVGRIEREMKFKQEEQTWSN